MNLKEIVRLSLIAVVTAAALYGLYGCGKIQKQPRPPCPSVIQGQYMVCPEEDDSTKPRPGPNPIHGTGRGTIYDKD